MKAPTRLYVRPGPRSKYRRFTLLGPNLDCLLAWMRQQGYAEVTILNILKAAGPLWRWLQKRCGNTLRDLAPCDLRAASDHFRIRRVNIAVAARLLGRFLAENQLIRADQPEPPSKSEQQLHLFNAYLRDVRGLAPNTLLGHTSRLRLFLQFLSFDEQPSAIRKLDLDQIDAFLRLSARTNNRFSLQHIVASLRAFLRHKHMQGELREPLHQRIDRPRTYRLEQLPRALPWDQIDALLRSIDQMAPGGLRDFTILYLATRYGLRSGELVRLTLDDIDWRAGVLTILQSKTKRMLSLPLSDEAGHILARYLKSGRPAVASCRTLFLRRRAPAGALAPTAIHNILELRIAQSGLKIPPIGSHVLRHSLAVHLLRRGVGLPAIGAALGHHDPESTSVYLRLAIDDLREVGLPVPSGVKAGALAPRSWKQKLPPVRTTPTERLSQKEFHSGLAVSLRLYLDTRHALGRRYASEEAVLRRWDDFLRRRYGKTSDVKSHMFQQWVKAMPVLSPTVRRNRMRIVRNFLLFHARQHPSTHIPDLHTFPRPVPHRLPRLVSNAEMARVLATTAALPASHQNPIRAQTIRLALILLFCCGLRRGELFRLRLRHFDPQSNVLSIEATKFHKSRLVPVSDSVAKEVHDHLALRRRQRRGLEAEAFLLWSNNVLACDNTYSAQALADNWQQLCLSTNLLDERGRPPRLHDLRHSFAVAALHRWYQQGLEVQSKLPHLAAYMGHVSPISTHYYLHLSPDLQHDANQRFHQYASPLLKPGDVL
jgi:integrase/recombinase XerD